MAFHILLHVVSKLATVKLWQQEILPAAEFMNAFLFSWVNALFNFLYRKPERLL